MSIEKKVYLIETGSIEFWMPLFLTLAAHAITFVIAQIHGDNGIIDVQWGLSFIIGNITILVIRIQKGGYEDNLDTRILIMNVLVAIWGLRMAIHVFLRTERGKEDRRFEKLRGKLMEVGGAPLYYCVAFFGIFMFNGGVICLINGSALYISMFSKDGYNSSLTIWDAFGIGIWLIGFLILTVADHQLRMFKIKRAKNETDG